MSDNASTPQKSMAEVVGAVVKELSPLGAAERQRVIRAALALLGDEIIEQPSPMSVSSSSSLSERDDEAPPRARMWMRQNGISQENILQVFHSGPEGVEIIAPEIPGSNNREKVRNAYVLVGIAKLFAGEDAHFDDLTARSLCERFGFYDPTNHSKYVKGGNEFVGAKEKGWTVTAPGLKQGAALVKQLASGS